VPLCHLSVVPVPVRDTGGQYHQMAGWHFVVLVGDVYRQDALEHEVELIEGVDMPGRAR
jgi:hypothetical protein